MYIDPPFSPPPCQRAGISAQILGRSTDAKKKYLKRNSVEYFTFISVIFYSKSARKTLLKRSTQSGLILLWCNLEFTIDWLQLSKSLFSLVQKCSLAAH